MSDDANPLPPVPDVQLTMPELGETLFPRPPWKRPLFGGWQLHLDMPPLLDLDEVMSRIRGQINAGSPPDWALLPAWTPPTPPPAWLTPPPAATPSPWTAPPKPPQPQTPWSDSQTKPASVGDLLKAVLEVPAVKTAKDQLQADAQSEMGRLWQATKNDPTAWAFAVPVLVGVGASAYLAGTRLDPVKNLGTTDVPLVSSVFKNSVAVPWFPALKIDWTYDSTLNKTLTDPLHPKRYDIGLTLDVLKLIRGGK
jgi:hypothetical protein